MEIDCNTTILTVNCEHLHTGNVGYDHHMTMLLYILKYKRIECM